MFPAPRRIADPHTPVPQQPLYGMGIAQHGLQLVPQARRSEGMGCASTRPYHGEDNRLNTFYMLTRIRFVWI